MRNPIFAHDSLFLDRAPDGSIRYVTGDQTRELSCGAKIIRLETRQPLVEITTTSGKSLTMAPESAFALHKTDSGALIRYAPVEYATPAILNRLDWFADLDDLEPRRYAIAGMIVGNGIHLFNRYRASYTIVPDLDSTFEIQSFLTRLGNKFVEDGLMHMNSNQVTCQETVGGWMIRSRIITLLVGNLLAEKTLTPTFYPDMIDKALFHCFVRGLLSTAPRDGEDIVVRHRDAAAVRTLGEHLYYQFGVPCDICLHPMEPRLQAALNVPEGHRFRLSSEHQNYAVLAGLLRGTGTEVSFFKTDTIETITPLTKKVASIIVLPGSLKRSRPLTANGFAFRDQFQIPVGIAEIASHPALLQDSSDPATF